MHAFVQNGTRVEVRLSKKYKSLSSEINGRRSEKGVLGLGRRQLNEWGWRDVRL